MDTCFLQNPAGGSTKRRTKRGKRKKGVKKNGSEIMDQMHDNVEASDEIGDPKVGRNDVNQPLAECPTVDLGSTDEPSEVNTGKQMKRKRKGNKKKDSNGPDTDNKINVVMEASDIMRNCKIADGGLEKNLIETDLTVQPLTECHKADTESINHLSEGNTGKKKKKKKKKVKKKTEAKDEGTVLLSGVVEVSSNRASSGAVEEISAPLLRPMELEEKFLPHESPRSQHPNHMAEENAKLENEFKGRSSESVVDQGKCSSGGKSAFSSCNMEVTLQFSSFDEKETKCLSKDLGPYRRISATASIKRKLLVLDVNGLLAHIVMPAPTDCRGDTSIYGRQIFKRPFYDDFLNFCFQNFDVGIWSSRSKKIVDRVVDYLLGGLKDKILFCWNMSHATQTGFRTLENSHKPLVCKELRKIWECDDPSFPWRKGDYDESNTLLLDDSPYKALLNPMHTAIFPNSYDYKDRNDSSLGPGGDLRVYLEGLLSAENVQKYVEQHPFGQMAINETNLSWEFYSGVLQSISNQLNANNPTSLRNLS